MWSRSIGTGRVKDGNCSMRKSDGKVELEQAGSPRWANGLTFNRWHLQVGTRGRCHHGTPKLPNTSHTPKLPNTSPDTVGHLIICWL